MQTNKVNTGKKREQFVRQNKNKKPLGIALVGLVVVGAIIGGVLLTNSPQPKAEALSDSSVATERSYIGRVVEMTAVEPTVEGEWVNIPLAQLEEHEIVYFELENDEGFLVPLMAYITPSGNIFTGSSMCEPCRGRYFSLAGETLVCNTCRTTYTIEDRQFISGSEACGAYPPVAMFSQVENGTVKIALAEILSWRIRAL